MEFFEHFYHSYLVLEKDSIFRFCSRWRGPLLGFRHIWIKERFPHKSSSVIGSYCEHLLLLVGVLRGEKNVFIVQICKWTFWTFNVSILKITVFTYFLRNLNHYPTNSWFILSILLHIYIRTNSLWSYVQFLHLFFSYLSFSTLCEMLVNLILFFLHFLT